MILRKGNYTESLEGKTSWETAQIFEKDWWHTCQNTVWEDLKQMDLAQFLGLKIVPNEYTNLRIPLDGQSVLDIGGGPSSILLKCENYKKAMVADPCDYPDWVGQRYRECGIDYYKIKGEDLNTDMEFDEVWFYNCLQHTENPQKIVENALKIGKVVRVFEWIETGLNEGHLHSFTKEQLDSWLKGEGKINFLNINGLHGKAYSGIFKGERYK